MSSKEEREREKEKQAINNMMARVAEFIRNNPHQIFVELNSFDDYEDGIDMNDILNEFNQRGYRAIQINDGYDILFERRD